VNNKFDRTRVVVAYSEVSSQLWPGGSEEKHKQNPQR